MTVDAIAEIRAVQHPEGHVRVPPGEVERAVAVAVRKALEEWSVGPGTPVTIRVTLTAVLTAY